MRGGTGDEIAGSSTTARAWAGSARRAVGAGGRTCGCMDEHVAAGASAAFDGARADVTKVEVHR